MAEELGSALLRISTDDANFDKSIDNAQARAQELGNTLDLASGSSVELADRLVEAASSGDRGAQAFLRAGTAIEELAAAQAQSKDEIDNARASLNAGTITLEQYNKEVLQSRSALGMFEDSHRQAQNELKRTLNSMGEVTSASGAQRQGLIQLGYQLGDMSTMYSMGMRPQQIFASQIGQITQAIQLMGGEANKFTTFLGGPWGIAISTAVIVLGPLIGKLLETADAADTARGAMDDLVEKYRQQGEESAKVANAQGVLNKMYERRLEIETRLDQLEEKKGKSFGQERSRLRHELYQLRGDITLQEAAVENGQRARERNAPKPSSTAKSKSGSSSSSRDTMASAEDQSAAIAALEREFLQARLSVTTDAEERASIEADLLALDRERRLAEIENNERLTQAQKDERKAIIERTYGKAGADGEIIVGNDPAHVRMRQQQDAEAARLDNDMLARQANALDAWSQIAPTLRQRAELEARALEIHQQIERNLLEQQIASGQIADAEKARALLASQQEASRTGLSQRNEGPLARFNRQMQADQAETGLLVESLIVQELDYVHQQLTDSIAERIGVKDPFLKGLIMMFVQDQFIAPMAQAMQGMMGGLGGGGGGGLFGSIVKGALGGVSAAFGGGLSADGIAAAAPTVDATIAEFAGYFAEGGTIPAGSWGIAGEAGPEPIFGGSSGVSVMSNPTARGLFGGAASGPGSLHVTVSGARGNAEIEEMVNSGVSQALSAYDEVVGGRVEENIARYR
ncbi:MAG: hypothetical protein VYD90_13220 [Pseudomonadota bacterium]|nr:hypothetical protein [Pseudomonadota bacterium]